MYWEVYDKKIATLFRFNIKQFNISTAQVVRFAYSSVIQC